MIEAQITLSEDFTAGLDKLVKDVQEKVLFSGAAAMANVFYEEAKVQALKHFRTGTLYDAIYRVYSKDQSSDDRVVYEVSWNKTKAPHGMFLEFGTSKMPAYPFIRPAMAVSRQAVEAGMERMKEKFSEVSSERAK